MAIIGRRLKTARENAKLTQMEASKKIGISNGTLSGYERNYRDPDTETLTKMADLYDVSIEWLMGRAQQMKPEDGLHKKNLDDPQTNLMFDGWLEMDDDQRKEALDFMEFLRSKKDKKEK